MKIIILIVILCISNIAKAQPPQMAIDSCKYADQGSNCSFNAPHGKVEGTCERPPAQQQLVCVPNRNNNRSPRMDSRPQGMQNRSQSDARGGQTPRTRRHTITQTNNQISTVKANTQPITENKIDIRVQGNQRILISNGISRHLTGNFPNRANPNSIKEQNYTFKIPANPEIANKITPLGLHKFGLGINGIPFDPLAAEWYLGDRDSGWQYEAMSGAIPLGLDENHAHVQPNGAYHYHGMPSLLASSLIHSNDKHSPIIGWAADGFPIYALYGYQNANNRNSPIIENTSSYRLRQGQRPSGGSNPGGYYDGTFVADYEYIEGAGSLDECNGRNVITPEFPSGTYAYFLTNSFPVIPRCYKGTPSTDFSRRPGRP